MSVNYSKSNMQKLIYEDNFLINSVNSDSFKTGTLTNSRFSVTCDEAFWPMTGAMIPGVDLTN